MIKKVPRTLDELVTALQGRSIGLLLGAGISIPVGIPTGYKLPVEFARAHPEVVEKHGLQTALDKCSSGDWHDELAFTHLLTVAFPTDANLQESLLTWLKTYPAMDGQHHDDHATFVLLWLCGTIRHLVTTNWDFMLEYQIDAVYDQAFDDPNSPVRFCLSDGSFAIVESGHLFHMAALGEDDFFLQPRYDIVAAEADLAELDRGSRVLWKIHGSPFFLTCPECRGVNRWKRIVDLRVGDPCPEHPDKPLGPEIVFWGNGVDKAEPPVWRAIRSRLRRCDLVLAVGFSGGDLYIRKELEAHRELWVVAPSPGEWDLSRVNYVPETGTALAKRLRTRFF